MSLLATPIHLSIYLCRIHHVHERCVPRLPSNTSSEAASRNVHQSLRTTGIFISQRKGIFFSPCKQNGMFISSQEQKRLSALCKNVSGLIYFEFIYRTVKTQQILQLFHLHVLSEYG